ncbi:uncharacterized protein ColSpa_12201 [Colletotrichum spaethianum]|uniref:Uncharacterized protein n=1 Tax=Colletotrichum spaethianum TaxID=700344 RepID=A0AA37UQ92_9PEZI|nr:uncharacterized protein ColSpa_12201 [Colletotrichum spaethianum]GKT52020.1 hypothetical protein ColSpa_12201 [Colletotrichum spaethianum]
MFLRILVVVGFKVSPSHWKLGNFSLRDLDRALRIFSEAMPTCDQSTDYHCIALFIHALESSGGESSFDPGWKSKKLSNDIAHGLNARFYGSVLGEDDDKHFDNFISDTATALSQTVAFLNWSVESVSEFVDLVESTLPVATPRDLPPHIHQ